MHNQLLKQLKKGKNFLNFYTLKFLDKDLEKAYEKQINKTLPLIEGLIVLGFEIKQIIIYFYNWEETEKIMKIQQLILILILLSQFIFLVTQ